MTNLKTWRAVSEAKENCTLKFYSARSAIRQMSAKSLREFTAAATATTILLFELLYDFKRMGREYSAHAVCQFFPEFTNKIQAKSADTVNSLK